MPHNGPGPTPTNSTMRMPASGPVRTAACAFMRRSWPGVRTAAPRRWRAANRFRPALKPASPSTSLVCSPRRGAGGGRRPCCGSTGWACACADRAFARVVHGGEEAGGGEVRIARQALQGVHGHERQVGFFQQRAPTPPWCAPRRCARAWRDGVDVARAGGEGGEARVLREQVGRPAAVQEAPPLLVVVDHARRCSRPSCGRAGAPATAGAHSRRVQRRLEGGPPRWSPSTKAAMVSNIGMSTWSPSPVRSRASSAAMTAPTAAGRRCGPPSPCGT